MFRVSDLNEKVVKNHKAKRPLKAQKRAERERERERERNERDTDERNVCSDLVG